MGSNRSRRSRSKIHAEAKASPPAQQARRDALVQLRGGEIVDVVLARDAAALGRFVRVRPLEEEDGLVVLAMKRGRQTLGSARGHLRQVRPDKILGVVLRMDGRSPHQGQDGQGRAEGSSSSADTSAELDPRQLLLFSAESDPPK